MDKGAGAPPQQPQAPRGLGNIFKGNTLKLAIALVVLVVVVLVTLVVFPRLNHKSGLNPLSGKTITYGPPPKGLLIMTVARKSGNTEQLLPAVYDLGTKKLSYPPVTQLTAAPQGTNLAIEHSFSSNGNYVTFVGAVNPPTTGSPYMPTQIYRASLSSSTKSNQDLIAGLQQAQSITSGAALVRLAPSISNMGDVVYFSHTGADTGTLTSATANKWDIHLVLSSGTDRILASGIYPKWVGDDQFVFIKDDGLYLYSLANKSEKKVWGTRSVAYIGMSLSVSNDYHYLAWAVPGAKGVLVFEALNWGAGELNLKGTFHLIANGVVFSPDNSLLIVQSPLSTNSSAGGIVESFFDLDTMKIAVPPYVIRNVNQDLTFLTDWIL